MDCAKAKEYLHPYIDGALPAAERRELEQHLLFCPDCTAELKRLRALSQAVRSLPQQELPPGFNQALHEALAAEPAPQKPALMQRGWVRALSAAAMLMLVIGLVTVGGNALRGVSLNNSLKQEAGYAGSAAAPAPTSTYMAPRAMPEEAELYVQEDEAAYDMAAEEPAAMPESYEQFSAADSGSAAVTLDSKSSEPVTAAGVAEKQLERKIIRDANLSLRVEDFLTAYQILSGLAERYGGYVVGSEAYNYDGQTSRNGYITLRVEANRLDEALAEIESLGKVENRSVYTQDVTMTYYDIEGRRNQYKTQEQRLLEILAKAETVEDLVTVERELTRVRAELESLTGQLRYYDQMTALSSISVNLYQPDANTQTVRLTGWAGLAQDIRAGFIGGVNGLLDGLTALVVGFFRLLPLLLLLAVVIFVLVLLIKRRKRK